MDAATGKRPGLGAQAWHDALSKRFAAVTGELAEISKEIEERMQLVKEREDHLAKMEAMMEENAGAAKARIKFDVGGRIFSTAKSTLLKREGTYFHALLCSGKWEPAEDGAYFIDRDPRLFDRIMASLRTDMPVDTSGLLPSEVKALKDDVDYYMMGSATAPSVRWDCSRCGPNVRVTDDGHTVTKSTGASTWNGGVLAVGDDVPSFQVRITNRGKSGAMMVGYAKANAFRPDTANYNTTGWFLYVSTGCLYSCDDSTIQTGRGALQNGDLVKVSFDRDARQIRFEVNEQDIGIKFENVGDTGPIVPCIDFADGNASVTIVD